MKEMIGNYSLVSLHIFKQSASAYSNKIMLHFFNYGEYFQLFIMFYHGRTVQTNSVIKPF